MSGQGRTPARAFEFWGTAHVYLSIDQTTGAARSARQRISLFFLSLHMLHQTWKSTIHHDHDHDDRHDEAKMPVVGGARSCCMDLFVEWILSVIIFTDIIVWVRNGAAKSVVMGNWHCLRFEFFIDVCSVAKAEKQFLWTTHCRRLNFCEMSLLRAFSRTFSLVLHVAELILPGRVQHCFFFVFFFNFSCLCSEHCSKLEHSVASVFTVYIIILRFSSLFLFYLFIYFQRKMYVFRRLNF